jgi:hypothetical protein
MIKKLLFTLFIVLIQTLVFSQTKTYNATTSNWNIDANWSPVGIPTSTDDVIIPLGKNVEITAAATAKSVSISGSLKVKDGIQLVVGNNSSSGDFTVNSGGNFDMLDENGSGDISSLLVYGNYLNNGFSDFGKGNVVILGDLNSPTTTTLQNNGNIVVGGSIIGVINTNGSGSGQIYVVNVNGTIDITSNKFVEGTNVVSGAPVPTSEGVLVALVNTVIYGSDCPFTISGTTTVSACVGGTAIFTSTFATTSGSTPSYQWEVNMGSGWSDLLNNTVYSGVNTGNLTVSNITAGMNNYKFRARITASGCTEKGNYGFLTVSPSPTITTQPVNQLDCEGHSVNFSVVATGTGLTYSWKYKKPGDISFTNITLATSNVNNFATNLITIMNVGSAQFPNGTQFQVVVANGTCDVSSSIVTLSVNEITNITSGTSVTMCYGSNHFYTVTTSNPSNVVSYQWKKSVVSGTWNNIVDGTGTHYSGATTATLNIINGTPNESAEYRVYITFHSSGADCNTSSDSRTRSLTFLPLLLTPAVVLTQPTCSNATGVINVTVQSATDTYSFDNGANYQASNIKSALTGGTYKVIIKNIGGCISSVTNCVITGPVVSTWDGSAWSPSAPTSVDKIIFNGNYLSSGDITACSCQVNSGAVVINSGHTLSLANEVTVSGGSLTFENNSSLIQTNTGTTINTGTIIYKRNSTPIINDDYTYWSSPTNGTQTLLNFSPYTQGDKFFIFDNNWANVNTSSTFLPGIGYSIRSPEGTSASVASSVPFQFTGIPNNGTIAVPVTSQQDASGYEEGIRLVGNPYPSAIDADAFIDANITGSGTINKTITGTLYFWTHNHTLSGNDYLATDYATYTKFGGTGTASALSGTGNSSTPVKYIASGQGFFVEVDATGSVTFNNAMRGAANNANFYKTATKKSASSESHRVWLNLTNNSKNFSQALMGYSSMATNEYDPGVDGASFDGDQHSIYSLIGEHMLTIQAKGLPFNDTDTIPLGYVVNVGGNTIISIDHVDGMFVKDQRVFLEDLVLGVIHDIKIAPYTFSSEAGTFNDRFVLRFTNADKTLGTDNFETLNNTVLVSNKNKQMKINSSEEVIDKVQVYDLLGRLIYQKINVNTTEFLISNLVSNRQALLVKIILENGQTVTKKIVY